MAIVKQFLRDTQTNAGTGGIGYDLSTVQGTAATLVSGTINNATYAEQLFWQVDGLTVERINTSSFPTSIEITALTASPSYRWRLQRVNSSNVVQASSAYSTVHNTTGTKTETLTFTTTWNTGDRLRLSLEVNREAGHSASGVTVGVNRTTSFVDYTVPDPYEESVTLSGDSDITADNLKNTLYEESVSISSDHVFSPDGIIFDKMQRVYSEPEIPANNSTGISRIPYFQGDVFDPVGHLSGGLGDNSAIIISKTDTNQFGLFKDLGFERVIDDYIFNTKVDTNSYIFFKINGIQMMNFNGTSFTTVGNFWTLPSSRTIALSTDHTPVNIYDTHIVKMSSTRYLLFYRNEGTGSHYFQALQFDGTDWTALAQFLSSSGIISPLRKSMVSYKEDCVIYRSSAISRLIVYNTGENNFTLNSISNLTTSLTARGVCMKYVAERVVMLITFASYGDLVSRYVFINEDNTTATTVAGHDYGFFTDQYVNEDIFLMDFHIISPTSFFFMAYGMNSRQTYFSYLFYSRKPGFGSNHFRVLSDRIWGQITGSTVNDIVMSRNMVLVGTDLLIFRYHNNTDNGWILHKAKVNDIQRVFYYDERAGGIAEQTELRKFPDITYPVFVDGDTFFGILPPANTDSALVNTTVFGLQPNTVYYWSFYTPIFLGKGGPWLFPMNIEKSEFPYSTNNQFTTGNDFEILKDIEFVSDNTVSVLDQLVVPLYTFDTTFDNTFAKIQELNIKEESITFAANSNIVTVAQMVMDTIISFSTLNELQAYASLISDVSSAISADSDTLPFSQLLMELSSSLTSDTQVQILSNLVYDSMASLSGSSNITVELNAILQGFVDLISNGTVTAQASVLFEETITLLKDAQVDYDALQVLETIITITSHHELLAQAGLVTDASVDLDTVVFTEAEMVKIIEAAVSLLSQADITGQVNAIMEEVSTIIADSSITVDGNLLYELVISLLGDSDITVLASKVLDETLILSSQHLDSYQVQAIVDEAVDIISNSLIEFQVYLLVERTIELFADSGLEVDSEAVYENAITLLTDADFQASLDSFIDVSVEISSAHFTDAQSEAIMDALVDLTMEGVIEAQINKIIEGVVSLLSDSGITVDVNIVVNAVSLILSSSNITSQGNIETEEDVSMQSDHDIFIDEDLVIDLAVSLISESLIDFQIEAILSNAITILADSGIEADTEMVMEALAEILSGSEIVASTGNIFTGEVDLNSSHFTEAESEAILVALVDLIQNSQIDSASIAEMENASQIGSDAQIDKTGNILMDGSVSLDFNTQIQNIGSLLIEKNIMLFTESFITSLGNVLVDESVLFDTDASTDEGYNTIFSKVVELIMNSIVQASADSESSLDITLSLNTEYTVTAQHLIAEISYLIANADVSFIAAVESADGDEIALLLSTGIVSQAFAEFIRETQILGQITDTYDAVLEYFAFIGLDVSAEAVYELFVEINAIFEAIAQASITFVEEYIPGQVPSEYEEAVTVSAIAQLFVNLTTVDGQALKIIGISMFRFINKLK